MGNGASFRKNKKEGELESNQLCKQASTINECVRTRCLRKTKLTRTQDVLIEDKTIKADDNQIPSPRLQQIDTSTAARPKLHRIDTPKRPNETFAAGSTIQWKKGELIGAGAYGKVCVSLSHSF